MAALGVAALGVASAAGPAGAAGYWQPANTGPDNGPELGWYLAGALNTSSQTEMGTTAADLTGYQGVTTGPPSVYDIDAIENPASTVSALHAMGDHAVCYIEVGTAGNYYTAAQEGIPTTYYAQLSAAGDLGRKLSGYPEYFININASSAVPVIEAMIQQQCAAKGFDAVETDLDETFGGNEGNTGFTITQADEESYLTTLASYMHGLGLAWVAKNLDDTGIQSFVTDMAPQAQAMISEECAFYGTCSLTAPFTSNGKPVWDVEYKGDWGSNTQADLGKFCPADLPAGINGALKTASLNGTSNFCR